MNWSDDADREFPRKGLRVKFDHGESEVDVVYAESSFEGEPLLEVQGLMTPADLLAVAHSVILYLRPRVSAIEVAEAQRSGRVIERGDDEDDEDAGYY